MRRMHLCILSLLCAFFLLFPQTAFADKPIRWAELHITPDRTQRLCDSGHFSHNTDLRHRLWNCLRFWGCAMAETSNGTGKRISTRFSKNTQPAQIFRKLPPMTSFIPIIKRCTVPFSADLSGSIGFGGTNTWTEEYGVQVFSPIAAGWSYSHYDDFGAARSYGYRREHLGHDLMVRSALRSLQWNRVW